MESHLHDRDTLSDDQRSVLDLIAGYRFGSAKDPPRTHVLLQRPPSGEKSLRGVIDSLERLQLLSSSGPSDTHALILTPLGLLACAQRERVSTVAAKVLSYLQRRLEESGVEFQTFTWRELREVGVADDDFDFPLFQTVLDTLRLYGGGSWSMGPPPHAEWRIPQDILTLRRLVAVSEIRDRAMAIWGPAPPLASFAAQAKPIEFEPKSELARKLLAGFWFAPLQAGFLTVDGLLPHLPGSEHDIESTLLEFERNGLLSSCKLENIAARAYAPTPAGWTAREKFLRKSGARHPALRHQLRHELRDLVIAVIEGRHIQYGRIRGPVAVGSTEQSVHELSIYLLEYDPAEVDACCRRLTDVGLLVRGHAATPFGPNDAYDLTGRGRREYRAMAAPKLRVADEESILDLNVREHIEIFFAWQSEFKPSRNAIDGALDEAVQQLNGTDGLVRPLRVVQATSPGDGAVRIDVELQERIRASDFFVGDLTPVYAYDRRLRVNENVLVEVGFALASKDPQHVILLAMRRNDVPGEATNPQPAFDIAHVRRQEFRDKDELRRRLKTELEAALRGRGWLR